MRACAYSDDKIATVTPFTNNGRMVSVPKFLQDNEIPEGFTVDSFAECVEKASTNCYPELVTAVGFCMYIRRSIIDEIGYFDEVNFGKGYGEEVDFSFKATYKGYKNVLCDDTFVFHNGRASFLDTQGVLMEKNHIFLSEKYPELWAAIALFERSNPLKGLHDRLEKEMKTGRFQRKNGWLLRKYGRSVS
jgi:GT2 family glycosyltransferase